MPSQTSPRDVIFLECLFTYHVLQPSKERTLLQPLFQHSSSLEMLLLINVKCVWGIKQDEACVPHMFSAHHNEQYEQAGASNKIREEICTLHVSIRVIRLNCTEFFLKRKALRTCKMSIYLTISSLSSSIRQLNACTDLFSYFLRLIYPPLTLPPH